MNTIEQLLDIPGAATTLASKLAGRTIGQISKGFGDDPNVADQMAIYKAIEERYPEDTVSLADMFKRMVKNAKDEVDKDIDEVLAKLTPEQQKLWHQDEAKTDRQSLLDSLPDVIKMYESESADPDRWDDLPVIAQWSLLIATETGLANSAERYGQWAAKDTARGRTDTNAQRLAKMVNEARIPFYDLVTEFANDEFNIEALAAEAERGTAVPVRTVKVAA